MDLSPAFQPLITALYYLLAFSILAGLIKSPWFKGKFGEFLVNLSARSSSVPVFLAPPFLCRLDHSLICL